MQEYVLGFVFSPDLKNAYLIRKLRPEWQAGLLNGIGGKIECGESALEAMKRESLEEAGYNGDWTPFGFMTGPHFGLKYFYSVMAPDDMPPVTCEDEEISRVALTDIPFNCGGIIGNVPSLVFFAAYCINYRSDTKPALQMIYQD